MATRVDLNGIKTEIKSILDANNTSTAAPIFDLSTGMSTRVQKTMTVHPEMIRPQASFYPLVTCYVKEKSVDTQKSDIAKDQVNGKRRADIVIEVVGAVWNQNSSSDTSDPADTEINLLMENVEMVLRGYPNLNATVTWQVPQSISYFTVGLDHQTHLRAGIMPLKAAVYY